ncbi:MAG TPA: hypothetical protein RMH85_22870 [Polyangiaceae bacterium LLY-WYZ-15_(1-7)]|nr:hypothetical protein [Myxococcales bacterium]MAT27536.1 hypothetical protein [Sandaracinus sp.]HJK90540.1 hypothetical protein [Polyangiaceae bacterium LLY-WYZ-15_(1-7)]MBJ71547.1 hypothetical protein [Sandaracinus sp.]HJL06407.1 hypothetical protein [Polyangiaceae bacterium LLY-WYZ-15_(1-7)]
MPVEPELDAGVVEDAGGGDAGPPVAARFCEGRRLELPEGACAAPRSDRFAITEDGACFIDASCGLWCWGRNSRGVAASGDYEMQLRPRRVPGEWVSVTGFFASGSGPDFGRFVGIDAQGRAFIWGDDIYWVFVPTSATQPVRLGERSDWRAASTGSQGMLLLDCDGRVYARGEDIFGTLGTGYEADGTCPIIPDEEAPNWADPTPLELDQRFDALLPRLAQQACMQTGGELWCSGTYERSFGGFEERRYCAYERLEGPAESWKGGVTMGLATCLVSEEGRLFCAGSLRSGMAGDGRRYFRTRRWYENPDRGPWRVVSVGWDFVCGVKEEGTLWCWGAAEGGALGDPSIPAESAPRQVGERRDWEWVWSDRDQRTSCALNASDELWCWGENGGLLGVGDVAPRPVPTRVVFAD